MREVSLALDMRTLWLLKGDSSKDLGLSTQEKFDKNIGANSYAFESEKDIKTEN